VGKYAKGQCRDFADLVKHRQGGFMEFESEREFVVNIDGETINAKKICFRIVPKGINFVFPKELAAQAVAAP